MQESFLTDNMEDEYIDIVTKEGKPTGEKALKSDIHSKGLYHNTAHVWLYTINGEVLLAQRAATKSVCPLLWDVSVAGHVDSGEFIAHAAIREVKEEIGLDLDTNEMKKIGVFDCFQCYPNGIIDNEFHHTFIAQLNVPIKKLMPQKGEVEDLKLVTLDAFQELINNIGKNNHFIPSNKSYYEFVLNSIKMTL